jgi:hypothetical protein
MLLVEVYRNSRKHPSQIIQQKVPAKGQSALQDTKSAGMVREIFKAISSEEIKAVDCQVEQMSRVGVGVRRAVVRCYDYDFGIGLRNPMYLSHGTQDVLMVFEKV